MTTVENITTEPFGLDCKRTQLPIVIKSQCPTCGEVITRDLRTDHSYLSYPSFNEPLKVGMYHATDDGTDEHEWSVMIRLTVTAELL